MRIFLIYHKTFHPNLFYKDFFKSKIIFSFLIFKITLYWNALYAFPYPLGWAMLIPAGTVLYGFYQLITNPPGSVMMIQTFLKIFPLLTPRQKDVLASFISDDDVDAFLCEHFGDNWMKIFHKYEDAFRVILPTLFRNGLTISPNYHGKYACSTVA